MFSTAHRSKGLEFETVIVADDFTAAFTVEMYTDFGDDMVLEYHMGPRGKWARGASAPNDNHCYP